MNVSDGVIRVRDAQRVYPMGSSQVYALRGVNLEIETGEFVALMGASGSGKSTLLHVLGCLDRLDQGEYWLEGQEVSRLVPDQRAAVRSRRIGFIFQSFNLLPRLSAWENVALPLMYQNVSGNVREQARASLSLVGLDERAQHNPTQLSGGERQRVAIARALVTHPAILLADEPTGNLDSTTGQEIMALLTDLSRQGLTILMVTHDPAIAAYAHRRLRMQDGRILEPDLQGESSHVIH
jgi:putative ABC transport system ATP-binding protein